MVAPPLESTIGLRSLRHLLQQRQIGHVARGDLVGRRIERSHQPSAGLVEHRREQRDAPLARQRHEIADRLLAQFRGLEHAEELAVAREKQLAPECLQLDRIRPRLRRLDHHPARKLRVTAVIDADLGDQIGLSFGADFAAGNRKCPRLVHTATLSRSAVSKRSRNPNAGLRPYSASNAGATDAKSSGVSTVSLR